VLNSELPLNSRCVSKCQFWRALLNVFDRYHTVQEFNKGVYDYIIATDESGARGEQDSNDEAEVEEPAEPKEACEYILCLTLTLAD
jgi:hypothetical protein